MKNPFKKLLTFTMIAGTGAASVAFAGGEPMKLVNTKTGYVVVEFHDGKVNAKLIGKDVFVNEAGSIVP